MQEGSTKTTRANSLKPTRTLLTRAASAAVLSLAAWGAHAANVVVNGGFESGDFTGWGGVVNTSIVSTDPIGLGSAPANGSFNALVRFPDISTDGALLQVLNFDATNLVSILFSANINIFIANTTEAAQAIEATVTIGFFDPNNFSPISTILTTNMMPFLGDPPSFAPGGAQTGWIPVGDMLTGLPLTGPTSIGLGFLVNATLPEGVAVMLGVDDVVFDVTTSPVPVPPAWLLGASALAVCGRLARRKGTQRD